MEFVVDANFSSVNKTRLIAQPTSATNAIRLQSNVISFTPNNTLKILTPISDDQLKELAERQITRINIETASGELKIKVDQDKIETSSKGCKCGIYMK
jgi:hypothetical protein